MEITSEEKAARAQKTVWQREQRAARKAAGCCTDCGKPCGGMAAMKGFCDLCSAKIREREARKRDAAREVREAEQARARDRKDAPYCPHCGGRDVIRAGWATVRGRRKKRFRCKAEGCGRWSYGKALPPKRENPCPFCGARCWKSGKAANRRQRWICTGCGRKNTGLWPSPWRDPQGPFRRGVRTFYLGPNTVRCLLAYCNATGQSTAQAVRDILRREADEPLARWSLARNGRVVRRPRREPTPPEWLVAGLPDVREETTRARMRQGRWHRPVAMEDRVSVALDEKAWEGLVRAMHRTGWNHQATLRMLVENVTVPPGRIVSGSGARSAGAWDGSG